MKNGIHTVKFAKMNMLYCHRKRVDLRFKKNKKQPYVNGLIFFKDKE